MYIACMATKTISLSLLAYEKLKGARKQPEESFSQVVLRATWPEDTVTGAELLELWEDEPPFFSEPELATMEEAKGLDQPPDDKWTEP